MSESDTRNKEVDAAENDGREAIWAIRPRWSTLYFVLFTFQVVVGFGIATYDGLSSLTAENWIQRYFGIILRTGQVGIAAAILTFTAIELLDSIMLMSEWIRVKLVEPAKREQEARMEMRFEQSVEKAVEKAVGEAVEKVREKVREEARVQGREEARAELIAEMKDWDRRRRTAEQCGEKFDEPPPYLDNGTSDNGR